MTIPEIKSRFESVRIKYKEYLLVKEKADQFREMISVPAVADMSDRVKSDKGENITENKLIALLWYSEQADRLFQDYMILRTEAEVTIAFVKLPDEREVLTRRYIMYQKWETIAEIMHYSRQHITRIHDNALKHVLECYITPVI